MNRIFELLAAIPEVRKDKIAVLKKAITGGVYEVKADDIAGKIIKEMFLEFALTQDSRDYQGCRKNENSN